MPDLARTVGRYELLDQIGRGGMAVVYRARQTDLGRFVALKQLKVLDDDDPSYAQRFIRESRVAGSLSHPNIVTVFDYFEHAGTPYIAMEYMRRGSLRPYVGDLTLPQIAGVLEDLLAGLAHAEAEGIVHRDLKPENLMVTSQGSVKIADFGIAKATTHIYTEAFKTRTGTTIGTPLYMAPEQAMAQEVGPWTDLYSVGCMAFELLIGRVPFHDVAEPIAIMMRQINEPIPSVRSIRTEIDEGLSDWIDALLEKDPGARTRSVVDAREELEEIIIGLLGPRWRRESRLPEQAKRSPTPAPSDEPGAPGESRPYTPPPKDLPPGPLRPETPAPDAPPPEYETYRPPPPARPPTTTPDELDLPPAAASAPGTPADSPPSPPATAPGEAPASPLEALETVLGPSRRGPESAGRPSGSRRRLIAAAVAVLALLGVVAFLLAPSEETEAPLSLDEEVSGRNMSYRVPAGWSIADPGPEVEVPGLALRGPLVARPPGAARGEAITAGFTSTTDPSLLPASFTGALPDADVRPEAIRLPAGTAYRYAGLRPEGRGPPVTVIALPTSRGVATLACRGAPGSSVARACDAVARTLELPSGRVYAPPPRGTFATALNQTMGRMATSESRAALRLGRADRPRELAGVLDDLQASYDDAADEIGRVRTAPFERDPTRAIERQLRRVAATYSELGAAARNEQRDRYRSARRRATGLRAELEERLTALRALGHDVGPEGSS
jgi:serine/threonine protein kinase